MVEAKGFSLWLMPTGDTYRMLAGIISELSKKYSAPVFKPHVTLLGELLEAEEDITTKAVQLVAQVKPFTVTLTSADYLDQYFRCLFLRAQESPELMDTNSKAREIFSRYQDPKFMPHLSLMYGDFQPQVKQQIIADIGREFNTRFDVGSVHLFSTNGEPKDWYRVKEFELK